MAGRDPGWSSAMQRELDALCADERAAAEATRAAREAVEARLALWDGVLEAIRTQQPPLASSA